MGKFITGKNLEDCIYNIIWEAENTLLIVSPFIKLDKYFKELFDKHENNPKLHLLLVFGKNEKEVRRSMSKADFDYFKKFLNISIIYIPNLHAKYYGNEKMGVITSINLYDYSFNNNIEFGVCSQQSLINKIKTTDNLAWDECMDIAENGEVVFVKRPVYEEKKLLVSLGKNYVKSDILLDATEKFYGYRKNKDNDVKRLADFPKELLLGSANKKRPQKEEKIKQEYGFCIRTGKKINFNPRRPMCLEAWQSWSYYKNEDFPEKYCHKTGEKSYGKTSMRTPILKQNL